MKLTFNSKITKNAISRSMRDESSMNIEGGGLRDDPEATLILALREMEWGEFVIAKKNGEPKRMPKKDILAILCKEFLGRRYRDIHFVFYNNKRG